jgi:hypothetical protein
MIHCPRSRRTIKALISALCSRAALCRPIPSLTPCKINVQEAVKITYEYCQRVPTRVEQCQELAQNGGSPPYLSRKHERRRCSRLGPPSVRFNRQSGLTHPLASQGGTREKEGEPGKTLCRLARGAAQHYTTSQLPPKGPGSCLWGI